MTTHIMLDIETLGTRPDSVIMSLGWVLFDPNSGEVYEETGTHHVFDIEYQIHNQRRKVSAQTLSFWATHGNAWPIQSDTQYSNIDEVLENLSLYAEDMEVWTHRSFDIELLNNYWYTEMDMWYPLFNFRNLNDSNQLFRNISQDTRNFDGSVPHNALGDAIVQARAVCEGYFILAEKGLK